MTFKLFSWVLTFLFSASQKESAKDRIGPDVKLTWQYQSSWTTVPGGDLLQSLFTANSRINLIWLPFSYHCEFQIVKLDSTVLITWVLFSREAAAVAAIFANLFTPGACSISPHTSVHETAAVLFSSTAQWKLISLCRRKLIWIDSTNNPPWPFFTEHSADTNTQSVFKWIIWTILLR